MSKLAIAAAGDVSTAFKVSELRTFRNLRDIPYAIVSHNPEYGLIADSWFGRFDSEDQFREVLEYICERFEDGGYSRWLADLRHLNRSFHEHEDWLAEAVFPRVINAGLEREAVVLPKGMGGPRSYDVFGSASAALKKITDGRVRGFTDLAGARKWLLKGS